MDRIGVLEMKQVKQFLLKHKKASVIGAVLILAVVAVLALKPCGPQEDAGLAYTTLAKTDLTDSVNVTGTIESKHAENVFTTLPYPVQSIAVELGDQVKAGDLLARLDTSTLSKDVEQARYTANASASSTRTQYETAKTSYENSKALYEAGAISRSDFLTAENSYKIAKANYENQSAGSALSKLEQQLADAQIKAPMDGVVTMVNATEGSPASGVLFVVEDLSQLIIKTAIKEFDVGTVKPGQPVTIKTDSTGDQVFHGVVESISPAARKGATGQTVSSSDVEFETTIAIVDQDPALKVGMNARLSITVQEKKSIFTVPFEAVRDGENGTTYVVAAESKGTGYAAKYIPVETGMETDFIIEVSGSGLAEGLLILSDPGDLAEGDPVKLIQPEPEKK